MSTRKIGIASAALIIGVSAGLVAAPSGAQAGFFEQLFGVPDVPSYDRQAAPPYVPTPDQHVRRPKKRLVVDAKPKRQGPTDLMHDATLRQGDAVMMKDGVHIYEGDGSARHGQDDFVAIDDADRLPQKQRAELVALDTTRNDPLLKRNTPDTIASGRSASVGAPIAPGYKITDARGKSLRYVGP